MNSLASTRTERYWRQLIAHECNVCSWLLPERLNRVLFLLFEDISYLCPSDFWLNQSFFVPNKECMNRWMKRICGNAGPFQFGKFALSRAASLSRAFRLCGCEQNKF